MATNNLKTILQDEGLKQSELKTHGGCPLCIATINRTANGKETPAPTSLVKIVRALNRAIIVAGGTRQYEVLDVFPNYPQKQHNGTNPNNRSH